MSLDLHPSRRRIVRDLSWTGASSVLAKVCTSLGMIVLVRGLGARELGEVATIWSLAAIAAGLTDLGAGQAMLQAGSRDSTALGGYFRRALGLKLTVALVVWAGVSAAAFWTVDPGDRAAAPWLLLVVVASGTRLLDSFAAFFMRVFQAASRVDLFAKLRAAGAAAVLAGFAAVVALGGRALAVCAVHFAVVLALTAALRAQVAILLGAGDERETAAPELRVLVSEGLPFLALAVLNLSYGSLETLLLAALDSTAAAGVYAVQYQLASLPHAVPSLLMVVLLPSLYRASTELSTLRAVSRRLCRYLNLLAWLVAPPLVLCSREVMALLGGAQLAHQHASLRVLALMVPLLALAATLELLVVVGATRWYLVGELSALAITLVGGTLLIPTLSCVGVAAAAVAGCGVSGLMGLVVLTRAGAVDIRAVTRDTVWMSLAAAPALALFWLPLPWWGRSLLFVAAAVLAWTASGLWDDEDRSLARELARLLSGRRGDREVETGDGVDR